MRLHTRRICTVCVLFAMCILVVYYVHMNGNGKLLVRKTSIPPVDDSRVQIHSRSVNDIDVIVSDSHNVSQYVNKILPVASTKLPQNRAIELDDIFISVKTTYAYHKTRLQLILDTWFLLAKNQVYFFTDKDDPVYSQKTSNHLINTNCSSSHHKQALCCKMAVEYDTFLTIRKPWFCHLDDDTYLHVANLLQLLREFDHRKDWYIGRPSLNHPLHLSKAKGRPEAVSFWFATGGAGYCISRALALKMIPYASGGKFKAMCRETDLPDDCSIGYIIYHYLNQKLTTENKFHSHLEPLISLKREHIADQVTFSYGSFNGLKNMVSIEGFPEDVDPSRFRSLNCYFYPYLKDCEQLEPHHIKHNS